MTVCLYECLRSVGLQRHYARFILMGVCRAVHLSALSIEDYPLLGVRSMEDRTRLFHLVQMIKTLDLKSLACNDGNNYDYEEGDDGCAVLDGSFSPDGYVDPDEVVNDGQTKNGAAMGSPDAFTFARPSNVCRRLSFSDETLDHHQRLFSYPVGTVHIYANGDSNHESVHGKASATPVQVEHHRRHAAVCGHQGSSNYKQVVQSFLYDLHSGGNTTQKDITGGSFRFYSDARFTSNCRTFPKQKSSPVKVTTKTSNNKSSGQKDRRRMSRKKTCYTDMPKPTPVYEVKTTTGYNYGLPLSSPPALTNKQLRGPHIRVCVRKRPLTCAECRRGEADVVKTPGGEYVIVQESKETVDLTHYILQHRFYFDQVFGEECSNEEVYQRTAYPLVQHMLSGGKATCFAYGQTGAGKTHTMLGSSPGTPGLYALAVRDIFAHLSTVDTYSSQLVYVSFFEIYCGQLYDLLNHRERLFAREDGQKVVHISGLQNVRVDSMCSLLQVISQGTAERTQGISGVNPLSSRSHALLQIQLRDPNQHIAGRMWFVDLAGSERASDAKGPHRQSRIEGAEINQSLLALKEFIRSLDKKNSHTPFRQSKLTQVLKDSLVGNSLTCMIANISPGHPATEHTLNTLRYADRVKELKGQGGPRGRRRGETVPSPRQNLFSSSSGSVGTPKAQKSGKQSEGLRPNTTTTTLHTNGTLLCSVPKNNRCGEETQARDRKEVTLEHTAPVGGWLGMDDKRYSCKGADKKERGRLVNESNASTDSHYIREKSTRAVPVLVQHTNEQQKGEEVNEGHVGKQVESSRDTNTEVNMKNERYLNRPDDKEKERHLKWYHQQLQQFAPSSTPSLVGFFSSSTFPSFSSSTQSSSSSLQQSSCLSVSAHLCHGLEEISDAYNAKVKVRADRNSGQMPSPSGEINVQNETSTNYSNNNDENIHSNYLDVSEEWGVSLEETGASFESPHQKAPAERPIFPSCEHINALQTPQKQNKAFSESQYAKCKSNIPILQVQNTPESVLLNSQRKKEPHFAANDSNVQSSTIALTTIKTQTGNKIPPEPFKRTSECPVYTHGHDCPDIKAKIPVLPQDESYVDSFTYIMDPLNSSLLQMEKRAAASSFLQRGSSSTSHCLLKGECGEDNRGEVGKCLSCVDKVWKFVEDENAKTQLSPLELPQAKLPRSTRSDSMTATNHAEQQKYIRNSGMGTNKHHISGFMLTLPKDRERSQGGKIPLVHDNKITASPLKLSASASTQTPVISPSIQPVEYTGSLSLCNPPEHACNEVKKYISFITRQQSESFPDHLILVHSRDLGNSYVSPKSNSPAELSDREINRNHQVEPTFQMYTLDNIDRAKWCIVEAHLEQLKEMEALCHKEGMLLNQQHNMAFEEYVHKLEEIMNRKARCIYSMRTQLQAYLNPIQSNHLKAEEDPTM